jgi:NADH-quinone oxidoreductase subunit F
VRIKDSDAVWMHSPFLGMCEHAPAAFVQVAGVEPREQLIGAVTAEMAVELLTGRGAPGTGDGKPGTEHGAWGTEMRLLKRIGVVEQNIDAFIASGGFDALRKALRMTPEQVIAEVAASKLMGRGGAAFPTARKWEAVAKQPNTPHYFICNADESEPGTFKDRVLMEGDPFAIIEGITIGAYATGCEKGFIYIRGEYPHATDALQRAIDESRAANFLGANILGSQFTFDIEIRRGAGAYICGEETAIFESIEGKRGEPRNKPPFPAQAGLFAQPTVVNNVETLANIPHIILDGGGAFASLGTAQSTGTRLFCVSGNVERAGVYEVVYGTTLREVIDIAGGVAPDRKIQAVLLGGAAGSFMRPDELDLRLTHEDTRAANTTLGSGVIMVFDDTVNMHAIVDRIAAFFRDESCGQCVPCRVGTVRQEEALHRIGKNKTRGGLDTELALLEEVGVAMRDASICGLGQTAYAAVESAIKRLRLYEGVGG